MHLSCCNHSFCRAPNMFLHISCIYSCNIKTVPCFWVTAPFDVVPSLCMKHPPSFLFFSLSFRSPCCDVQGMLILEQVKQWQPCQRFCCAFFSESERKKKRERERKSEEKARPVFKTLNTRNVAPAQGGRQHFSRTKLKKFSLSRYPPPFSPSTTWNTQALNLNAILNVLVHNLGILCGLWWEKLEYKCICMCVVLEPQVHSRGCNSVHWFHSQRPPCNISRKVFLCGASSKRLWRDLWGHEYVDGYPGGGREPFTAPTQAFYIKQGWSVGWREAKRRQEKEEIEGRKVNGRLFSHEVLFPVSTRQLSLFLASTISYSAFNLASVTLYWLCKILYSYLHWRCCCSLPINARLLNKT